MGASCPPYRPRVPTTEQHESAFRPAHLPPVSLSWAGGEEAQCAVHGREGRRAAWKHGLSSVLFSFSFGSPGFPPCSLLSAASQPQTQPALSLESTGGKQPSAQGSLQVEAGFRKWPGRRSHMAGARHWGQEAGARPRQPAMYGASISAPSMPSPGFPIPR